MSSIVSGNDASPKKKRILISKSWWKEETEIYHGRWNTVGSNALCLRRNISLLISATEGRELVIAQRRHPEAFANDIWFRLECVFGTGF